MKVLLVKPLPADLNKPFNQVYSIGNVFDVINITKKGTWYLYYPKGTVPDAIYPYPIYLDEQEFFKILEP